MSSDFRPKAYLKPHTKEELAETMKVMQGKAKIIGGGTGIYELAGRGLLSEVDTLVDISALGWAHVKKHPHSVTIGAATTMTEMQRSPALGSRACGAVTDALKAIQPLQVKNVATIGGAICTGLPFFDLPTALLAVDAKVRVGPVERAVRIEDFLRGYFAVDLAPHEFVVEVEIPVGDGASAFQKFALTNDDWAIMNCGASLSLDRSGRIKGARLAFGGGVGDKQVCATRTAKALEGTKPSEEEVKAVMERNLPAELQTTSDIRSSSEYRLELAKVLGRRTILAASERAS